MSKATVVVTIFLVAFISFGSTIEEGLSSLVKFVDSFDTFKNKNTGLNLTKIDGNVISREFHYSVGQRVQGDRIVAQKSESSSYDKPEDVTLQLVYPQRGIGKVVTFVDITVQQSSVFGYAKILSGGIGQRQIAIEVVANITFYFNYNALIYGY